jgi:hypothetical protein
MMEDATRKKTALIKYIRITGRAALRPVMEKQFGETVDIDEFSISWHPTTGLGINLDRLGLHQPMGTKLGNMFIDAYGKQYNKRSFYIPPPKRMGYTVNLPEIYGDNPLQT